MTDLFRNRSRLLGGCASTALALALALSTWLRRQVVQKTAHVRAGEERLNTILPVAIKNATRFSPPVTVWWEPKIHFAYVDVNSFAKLG